MLAKNGLVIVSNPKRIEKLLTAVEKQVKNTVYIQLLSAVTEPLAAGFHPRIFNSWPKFSSVIHGIYAQAAKCCQNLDVRVLLSTLKYPNVQNIQTQRQIDLVIFDKKYCQYEIEKFLQTRVGNKTSDCSFVVLESDSDWEVANEVGEGKTYKHGVLGGTFDRLHLAHKLLLSEAALRASERITVGVTDENMLYGKTLWELIQPLELRIEGVREFLTDICRELEISVVPIADPFGPTQSDPTMDLIVVSAETFKGGQKVNEVRQKNGLPPLEVLSIELIDEPFPNPNEEPKISSSTTRMRLLGSLLKPVVKNVNIAEKPYVIGLTGPIASGKSNVAKRLSEHGAKIINCDEIAHYIYKKEKPCYYKLIEAFGERIIAEDGEINRKVVGSIVFADPAELEKLNQLVWPAMGDEVNEIIRNSKEDIIVVEAAILTKAGWDKFCHEVWTTIASEKEQIERIKIRNNLTEEQAKSRLHMQASSRDYVQSAHVVFCTLWEVSYTYQQVDRAWKELRARVPIVKLENVESE